MECIRTPASTPLPIGTGGSTEVRTGWNTWDDLFQKYNLINNITEFDAAKGEKVAVSGPYFAPFPAVVVSLCQVFLHRILFAFKVVSFFSSALLSCFQAIVFFFLVLRFRSTFCFGCLASFISTIDQIWIFLISIHSTLF